MSIKKKVAVAMSGGVDSSVAAALLLEQGYDVRGVSLRMWERNAGPRVCSDHRGASEVATHLAIPHTLLDLRDDFADAVVRPFATGYLQGRTPNPCVACNRDFKFGTLLAWADEHGIDYVATGHYARVARGADGRHALLRGADRDKDQSYFLFALSQRQLARALFPLGEMLKSEVRSLARRLNLPTAERPESQDICFGDYRALVAGYATLEDLAGGDIVDRSGKVLGRHRGIHGVTIGQRRGLGIAAAEPLYVVEIDGSNRRVVVGSRRELRFTGLTAVEVNWLGARSAVPLEAEVQIRYRSAAIPSTIRATANASCEVRFLKPVPAVTPGQAVVFYHGAEVLGGGWIDSAIREEANKESASG